MLNSLEQQIKQKFEELLVSRIITNDTILQIKLIMLDTISTHYYINVMDMLNDVIVDQFYNSFDVSISKKLFHIIKDLEESKRTNYEYRYTK